MKKALLCLVALMLLVTFSAFAQTLELAYDGVTMTLPEDFVETFSDEGDSAQVLMYTTPSLENSTFIIVVAQEEEPSDNAAEDKLAALYEGIADDLFEASHEIKQLGDFTFLVVSESTGFEQIYATIQEGCMIQITCLVGEENGLTDAHTQVLEGIANSLKIEPAKAE